MWPLLGGIASGLISGIGSIFSNQQSAQSVQQQEAFQERMSGTAYQRGMADMKAAGLNPMLAFSQGGASTPGGGSFSAQNVGGAAVGGMATGANSAQTLSQMQPQIQNMEADTQLKAAQTASSIAQAKQTSLNSAITAAQLPFAGDLARGGAMKATAEGDSAGYDVKGHQVSNQYLSGGGGTLHQIGMGGADLSSALSVPAKLGGILNGTFRSLGY